MYKNILSNIQSVSVRILGLYLLMGSSNEVETSVARDIPRISTANGEGIGQNRMRTEKWGCILNYLCLPAYVL